MARAKLAPVPPTLVPGDSVRVLLEFGPQLETPAVPLEAVRRAPMNTFVFVAELDNSQALRAVERTVSVGTTIGDRVSILDGLRADDRVVVDGSFKLQDGALIVEVDPPAKEAGTAKSDKSHGDEKQNDGQNAERAHHGQADQGQTIAGSP